MRLSPTSPALSERKKSGTVGSLWKVLTATRRSAKGVLPLRWTYFTPACLHQSSYSCKCVVKLLNTNAFCPELTIICKVLITSSYLPEGSVLSLSAKRWVIAYLSKAHQHLQGTDLVHLSPRCATAHSSPFDFSRSYHLRCSSAEGNRRFALPYRASQ